MKTKNIIQAALLIILTGFILWGINFHINQWNRLEDRNTYLEQANEDLRTQNLMLMEEQW